MKDISNYLLILIFLTIGCSTSKKTMVKNSQEKRYEKALFKLKKGKSLKKNKELLINSINTILKLQTIKKDSLINSKLLEDKEKGYAISEYLYMKLDESKEYVNGQFDSQIISLNRERIELKKYLKESFYTRGKMDFETAKKSQDKYLSRVAYQSLNKSKKYGNYEINNLIKECSEYSVFSYHIRAKTTKGRIFELLIDDKFRELENLKLSYTNIYYNKKDAIKYDCEIEILFDELIIKDERDSKTKQFSRELTGQQTDSTTTFSSTIRGYVHQSIKKRKLNWDIIMKINSDSNKCRLTSNSFTEKLVSKSVNYTLSGDERAISRKYKTPIGKSLLSKKDMTREAIIKVYNKIEYLLRENH